MRTALEQEFKDVNSGKNARDSMARLCQGNNDVAVYTAAFKDLMAMAGINDDIALTVTVSSRPYLFPLSVGSPTSPHTPQTDHGTTSYDTRQPLFPRHRHITLLWLPSLLLSALGPTSSHVVHPHGYYASSQGIT
jgi:hypothetical protein